MCLNCKGLGNQFEVSIDKIIPDESISIEKGEYLHWERRRVIGGSDKWRS